MKIVAKKNFGLNGMYYLEGDEIPNLNYEQIVKLNEIGFIEPLDFKDLIQIKKELDNNEKIQKEE